MRRSGLVTQALLLQCFLLALLCASGITAAEAGAPAVAVDVTAESLALQQLERARTAALQLDYTGILVHQQGPDLRTSRITHLADASGSIERVQLLDGPPRDYVRRDSEITWYLPRERRIIQDQVARLYRFPALSQLNTRELLSHYRVIPLAPDRVSGRAAELLQLQPADGLRYGYRFWFDTATGLLLRAQSISETGQVVAQTSFSQLAAGYKSVERSSWPGYDARGWKVERAISGKADVSGWRFRLPPGFRQVTALRRVISSQQGATTQGTTSQGATITPRDVVQIVCSDGIAGISVFIEPWTASRGANPLHQGAVNVVGKRVGRFWLTIVGEVPMAAIRQIADSLELSASATR